jgi:geranylgeranyl pyrophosphate synthase
VRAPALEGDDAVAALWADTRHVAAIESLMRQLCTKGGHALGRLAWEHISTGGKRLRARLAVFAVQALGGNASEGIGWGASCELLHNASLIHDDIQDGDEFRRGHPTLWARYGVAQALNAGDLCIALGYSVIDAIPVSDAVRWQLTRTVARASRLIVEGQSAELALLESEIPGWSSYAKCVEGKTSALLSLPIEGAALIAGRGSDEAAALADACRSLGLLFQIQDDVLDLYGNNGRGRRGSDLAQAGKATAFVVEHLRLHPGDRAWLLDVLTTPRERTPPEVIDEVIERFAEGGALAAVWQRIDDICGAIERSESLAREPALRALVLHFAHRALEPVVHTRQGAAA